MKNIQYIEVNGTPYERGLKQGQLLQKRIEKNIEFYQSVVDMPEVDLLSQVNHFAQVIKDFNEKYAIEIEAIAEGAGVDPVWIYFLNCRTELINNKKVTECTTFFFKETSILGENWDWSQTSEKLMVVIKATDEHNNSHTQVTEPGILGKIGMNDRGIGVCLNILFAERDKVFGVPIHILCRAVLDSENVETAKKIVQEYGINTVSNLLIADASGASTDLELDGSRVLEHTSDNTVLFHTNHYLREENKNEWIPKNSQARYTCISEKVTQLNSYSIEDAKAILADKSEGEKALCRSYSPKSLTGMHGTVASIVMDLNKREMHITDGNPIENDYVMFGV